MAFLIATGFLVLIFAGIASIGAAILNDILGLTAANYNAAWWALLIYLLSASLISWLRSKLPMKSRPWLNDAYGLLIKGMWYAFLVCFLLGIVLGLIGKYTATEHRLYAQTTGEWYAMDYIDHDLGSDSYTSPISRRAPYLRDLQTGREFRVGCRHEDSSCYELLRNHGTAVETSYKTGRRKFSVRQARVTLSSTIFNKHTLTSLEYIDFPDLPEEVRLQSVKHVVCSGNSLASWQMLQAYPMATEMLAQATAAADRLCKTDG